ncbi:MAG: diguanylate cyclase [Deltaproteobacteria bacterium]|nr:diguanylate cyclase [Deltaproteobacteria bacterium]
MDGERILIVDDESSIREVLSSLLADEGFRPLAAGTAEEGLERMAGADVSVALIDIKLPGMDGIDLLKEVRRLHPDTEAIIMTSYASLETAVMALRSGAYDYLIKPIEELDLVTAAVSRAIDHASLVREKEALTEALARKNEELLEANRNLADQANRDGLTGLYNHRYFQDALRREIFRSERNAHTFALLFVDIDNFKKYNDREGHQAGDKVISTIGEMLRGCVRGCDVPARYGGEEFVVLLTESNTEKAWVFAERFREAVAKHPFQGREDQPNGALTVSMGLASYPESGKDAVELIRRADARMYEAKKAGGNSCRVDR